VDHIDLEIRSGEIFGILGPNGAGKTTTMRMLATLLEPTSGEARVLGFDVRTQSRRIRAQIGAMLGGERSLYWKLTARENLEFFGALYHLHPRLLRDRIDRLLRSVELSDRADDYVERFSTGMRQRLLLARALLPDPALLLLDEPTVGLDPQAAHDVRDRVRELRRDGRTVLLTTHYMEEADQLCDRVAIIDHGRTIALDSPQELKRAVDSDEVVRLEMTDLRTDGLLTKLAALAKEVRIEHLRGAVSATYHCRSARQFVPAALELAYREGTSVSHVEVIPVSLEHVFLALTGRQLRDE
jgi:ABC-2 type transport system ATP-binding protein